MVALWGYIGNKRNHSLSIKHSCRLLLNFCQGKNSSNAQKELKKKKKKNLLAIISKPFNTYLEGPNERERERESISLKVKKASPSSEDKYIFSISGNGLISLESICMDSPRNIIYFYKTLNNWKQINGGAFNSHKK
jgi:hypothetical protein